MKNVIIIDYGMGNIKSLYNSLKFLGYNPIYYSEKQNIGSNIYILPGVGAFNQAMKLIEEKKISYELKNFVKNKNNLLLGICLGMQLFFEESSENLKTTGLGMIKGKVKKLSENENHILPNVGYFETNIKIDQTFSYLKKFDKQKFYYVHSYISVPIDIKNQIASSIYNGKSFCAIAVKDSNIIGTQFHPEKSSEIGLEFLNMLIKNSIN
ncbi:imidazole glycerol phosphate synthase subunit HisH [Candidatus Pelagibacter sp.]|nr:imidazole glycerol phosphate synthase subunit HisH [Candidatus Pelagibacter sp.]